MKNNSELDLARKVAKKAKELSVEREAKLLANIRAEFYTQLSEVLISGKVTVSNWHIGEGVPAISLGNANDIYIDATSAYIYLNKSGEWVKTLNIKGESGKDGADGKDGRDGKDGEQGKTGLSTNGKDGRNGRDGSDGRNGIDGKNGKDGKAGASGSRWYTGRGVPKYDLGKTNDFFLEANSGKFYEKVTSMTWELKGSLKGPSGGGNFSTTVVGGGDNGGGDGGSNGTDGREVELRATALNIEWRYVGSPTWTTLIALSELKGADGSNGTNGTNGTTPVKGVDYFDGVNGTNGVNGIDGTVITVGTTPPASPSVGTLWVDTN